MEILKKFTDFAVNSGWCVDGESTQNGFLFYNAQTNDRWIGWQAAQIPVAPESFEQAYSEIFSPIVKQPYPRLENGDYKYIEIDQGWKLWQAATVHAVPEWISVKDKLPGFNQSVLSCDGFETCVAEYLESCKNEYGVFFEEGFWINGAASIFENVTHWMPLPEAIEAQEPTND